MESFKYFPLNELSELRITDAYCFCQMFCFDFTRFLRNLTDKFWFGVANTILQQFLKMLLESIYPKADICNIVPFILVKTVMIRQPIFGRSNNIIDANDLYKWVHPKDLLPVLYQAIKEFATIVHKYTIRERHQEKNVEIMKGVKSIILDLKKLIKDKVPDGQPEDRAAIISFGITQRHL